MNEKIANKNELDKSIWLQQLSLVNEAEIPSLFGHLMMVGAVYFVLKDVAPPLLLTVWSFSLLTWLVLLGGIHLFIRNRLRADNVHFFAGYFLISHFATGLIWGIGFILIHPEVSIIYQYFILMMIIAISIGIVATCSAYLSMATLTFIAVALPVAIMLFFSEGELNLVLSGLTLLSIFNVLMFSRSMNHTLVSAIRLRFENADLLIELGEKKEQAEEANNDKSRFLAVASHDLRQPLHAIGLFTSALERGLMRPEQRAIVHKINRSVDALVDLFNALLDISRLDAGVIKVDKRHFDLFDIIARFENEFSTIAEQKGLTIEWPSETCIVYSDCELLEQILRNYIANAIRYSNKGVIRIGYESIKSKVNIWVSDTGIGISEDAQQSIFSEFFQLDNPERDRSKGLGLGLSIVKRSAKLLDHPIRVNSTPGEGSTFSIKVNSGDSTKVNNDCLPQESQASDVSINDALIVIIDDEQDIREGMVSLFESLNCDVIAVSDSDEAQAVLKNYNRIPDGIISDYHLRDYQTGVEAIEFLRNQYHNDIPAIIITGDIAPETLRDVAEHGLQMLHKPVSPVKFRTFLRTIQLTRQ